MTIRNTLRQIVTEELHCDEDRVTDDANFIKDLGGDSLNVLEIVMAVEEVFGVEIDDDGAESMKTFGDAVTTIERLWATKNGVAPVVVAS